MKEEWPTLALLGTTYTAFLSLTYFAALLPTICVVIGLAMVLALHSSLQHEVLHGHPFKASWLSDLTVFPALGLFIPYLRFKDTHLTHHYDPDLTDPYDDPETNYIDLQVWERLPWGAQRLAQANNTLLGRMVLGPILSLLVFYKEDLRSLISGDRRIWRSYVQHGLGVALVLFWVVNIAGLSLLTYLCGAYLALSILKIRTFLEHRAHDRAAARSVIIEDRGLLALLFLNNNYHAVHHAHPQVHWHKLPALFDEKRAHFLTRNDGYLYRSYWEVMTAHLFRSKDPVAHPIWTLSNRTRPLKKRKP